jgi:hypothetical protein
MVADTLVTGLMRGNMVGMSDVGRLVAIAFVAGVLASFAASATAFAQSGSTGGTLGKQDKSQSGERQEETPAPGHTAKPAPAKPAAATSRYIGCFRDQQSGNPLVATTQGRDVNGLITNDANMTSARCIAVCRKQGFAYAGTQYATYCFCGSSYGRSGAADNCNMACGGNPAEMCGGAWANSVYSVSGATAR